MCRGTGVEKKHGKVSGPRALGLVSHTLEIRSPEKGDRLYLNFRKPLPAAGWSVGPELRLCGGRGWWQREAKAWGSWEPPPQWTCNVVGRVDASFHQVQGDGEQGLWGGAGGGRCARTGRRRRAGEGVMAVERRAEGADTWAKSFAG